MPAARKMKTKKPVRKTGEEKGKVAAIAKKVILSMAETQSPISNTSMSLNDNALRIQNLNRFIAQGDTSVNIKGEKVFLKNLHIKGYIQWTNGSGPVYNTPKLVRITVFKSKTTLTTTQSLVAGSDLFRQETGTSALAFAGQGHVDLHKNMLFYDHIFTIDARDMATTALVTDKFVPFDIRIPLNRTEYFDGDNSGDFKSGQYFLGAVLLDSAATTAACVLRYTWCWNLKDM